jgi:hypothetical protein
MAGKLEVSFVEKVRFEAAAKQVWRNIAGRTIEAIVTCSYPSFRKLVVMLMILRLSHVLHFGSS